MLTDCQWSACVWEIREREEKVIVGGFSVIFKHKLATYLCVLGGIFKQYLGLTADVFVFVWEGFSNI